MPGANAVPPHTHDDRYVSKREYGVRTEATRTVFGQQRKWPIPNGYSLLLPDADIDANAEISIEDGGELALVGGGGLPDHTDLLGLADDDHTQYLLASTYGGRSAFTTNWTDLTDAGATTLHKHDHGGQDGLTDDDHTQYPLLLGRSGGQTLIGGTAANDDLTLEGTSNATKTTSYVLLQPDGGYVGIGTDTPAFALHVYETATSGQAAFECEAFTTATNSFGTVFNLNRRSTGDMTDGFASGFGFRIKDDAGVDNLLGAIGFSRLGADNTGRFVVRIATAGSQDIKFVVTNAGETGINTTTPGGQLDAQQSSSTAAIPVLVLGQADLSEEFIQFEATVGSGNPIDTAALGTYYGKIRVSVNGTFKYIALYDS